jgi:murein DD-endopeptidase MepM/ murein hydrolase activator NlpD
MQSVRRVAITAAMVLFCGVMVGHGARSFIYYKVKSGDSLSSIAHRYHIPWKRLARLNHIGAPYKIRRGQRLKIPLPKGSYRLYRVKRGDTLVRIARNYGVSWKRLARMNNLKRPYTLYPGEYLKVPQGKRRSVKRRVKKHYKVASSRRPVFLSPVIYGKGVAGLNMGIDYTLPASTEVWSAAPGRVVYSSLDIRGVGSVLILEHSGGYETVYAGKGIYWKVGEGENVIKTQVLGESVEDTVLHFEIRREGHPIRTSRLIKIR